MVATDCLCLLTTSNVTNATKSETLILINLDLDCAATCFQWLLYATAHLWWFSNFIMPQRYLEGLWKQIIGLYSTFFEFVVCDEAQEFAFLKSFQNMLVYSAHLWTTDLTNLSLYCLLNRSNMYMHLYLHRFLFLSTLVLVSYMSIISFINHKLPDNKDFAFSYLEDLKT